MKMGGLILYVMMIQLLIPIPLVIYQDIIVLIVMSLLDKLHSKEFIIEIQMGQCHIMIVWQEV